MKQSTTILLLVLLLVLPPVQAQVPSSAPASPTPQGLAMDRNWETHVQGGSETLKDLSTLLGPMVTAAVNTAPDPSIEIFQGVTYLMPFRQAVEKLGLKGALPSRNVVNCPGFPSNSFFYYTFKGLWEGGYNIMNVVVDKADQVTSVQLVCESPTKAQFENMYWEAPDQGWRTYNFINYRNKANKRLRILHKTQLFVLPKDSKPKWITFENGHFTDVPSTTPFSVISVRSILFDPEARGRDGMAYESKPLEAVRWFLPLPLAQTLLYCVNKAGVSAANN